MYVHALLHGEHREGLERFGLVDSTAVLANDWWRLERTHCNNEGYAWDLDGTK